MTSTTATILSIREASSSTVTLFHGGRNLDLRGGLKPGKTGSWEFGPGLYLTDDYEVARGYAKGGGSVYAVTIRRGTDIESVKIDYEEAARFTKDYVKVALRQKLLNDLDRIQRERGHIKASWLVNLCINSDALLPSRTVALQKLLVDSGVDYGVHRYKQGIVAVIYNTEVVTSYRKVGSLPVDQWKAELPPEFQPN